MSHRSDDNTGAVRDAEPPVVWVLGDIAFDITLTVPSFPAVGGDAFAKDLVVALGGCGANISITLARLGISAVLMANIGRDSRGQEALATLAQAGVNITLVTEAGEKPTHLTAIVVTPNGERTIFGYRGASDHFGLDALELSRHARPEAIAVSGYALLGGEQLRAAQAIIEWGAAQCVPVFLDVPAALSASARRAVLQTRANVETLIVGLDEARQLSGSRDRREATAYLSGGRRRVVLTQGAGSLVYSGPDASLEVDPPAADSVDSTGAGDAFVAALVAARLSGLSPGDTLRAACAFGAVTTESPGAGLGLPGPTEVLAFLARSAGFRSMMSPDAIRWLRELGKAPETATRRGHR